jgi:PKD repeat protein
MKHHLSATLAALTIAAATVTGCTMKTQEAPDLAGPSEHGTSISVAITPDVLEQNGASQSVVTITARDPEGQPVRNLVLRAETLVNGTNFDFGTLSARTVVTAADGRATLVYTAPPAPSVAVDSFTIVEIAVTPLGSDFNNTAARSASVRLVPPNIIVPPDGLRPAFTFTPTNPSDHQRVLFDASTSEAPANNPIAGYSWNFGDGGSGAGRTATHDYSSAGTYVVTLTISDVYGRSASTSQTINVGAGVNPTAAFTFSPTEPLPNSTVHFNAAASRAAPGRTIVSYAWDFGDGGPGGNGVQVSRFYRAGNFTVTLVVTDDAGRVGVASQIVPVEIPEDEPTLKKGGTLRD